MQHVSLIFANADGLGEMAVLTLQEAYSLSVLMYAAPALHLNGETYWIERLLEYGFSQNLSV